MLTHLTEITIFIFGLCVGSFMNVCIYRLPTSKSIINPARSICPDCGNIIKFYDNIPVLSYLWLKGKCRYCNSPIAFRYLLVELIGGFLHFAFISSLELQLKHLCTMS